MGGCLCCDFYVLTIFFHSCMRAWSGDVPSTYTYCLELCAACQIHSFWVVFYNWPVVELVMKGSLPVETTRPRAHLLMLFGRINLWVAIATSLLLF